jgi:TonB-dependent starch-binding outer membrane protein SusC
MSGAPLQRAIAGILLGHVLAVAPSSAQQTGTIEGMVVEMGTHQPVAGAHVSISGTRIGVSTNDQGYYRLVEVPPGDVIVRVQRVGYSSQERRIAIGAGETASLSFELARQIIALDEVVVTGVGEAARRRELGTSVAVLGRDVIDAAPVLTLDQLLQGRVAGGMVNAVSAQPGTGSLMSFRGVSSVFGAQTPVVYVDGVRVDNAQLTAASTGGDQTSALADLLTSNIERVEITRGGAASTLYGSDAASGVIQIFTRRGTVGAPRVTARIEQGVDVPELKYILDAGIIYPDLVHADHPDFDPAAEPVPADFAARHYFRNGHYHSYSANVSGGGADATYELGGRILQSSGIQPDNSREAFDLHGNLRVELSRRLQTRFTAGFTRTDFGRTYNNHAILNAIGALELGDLMFFTGLDRSADNFRAALDIMLMPEITESVNRFRFSTGLDYDVSRRLASRLTIGLDSRSNQQRIFQPIGSRAGNEEGSLNRRQRDFLSVTMDAAATHSFPLRESVTSSLTVGVQGFRDNTSIVNAFGRGFALPGTKTFDEAADVSAFEVNQQVFTGGVYVDERIAIRHRLFVNLGFRLDAGTSFGDHVDFTVYPKAAAAYALGDQALFRRITGGRIDELQIRAAYGQTGKFPPPFLRDRTFTAVSFRQEGAARFDNPGNVDLRPEVTSTYEAGFEVVLLRSRVGLDFTYFDARTTDALFFVPEQPATGQDTQLRNVGAIRNRGIEVELNVHVLRLPDVSWRLGATYHTVDNRVTDMGGVADFFVMSQFLLSQTRISAGRPVGAWYVSTPVDTNGDGLLDGSELRFSGKGPVPSRGGSASATLELFRSLQLSVLSDWAGGHQVFDWGSYWARFNGILRRELVDCPRPWAEPDCVPRHPFPIRHDLNGEPIGPYPANLATSEFLLRGDWFKVREIAARYALPAGWASALRLDRAAVYGSVRNVAIFTPRSNRLVDPELAGMVLGGLDLGAQNSIAVSPPRQFRLGIEVGF